MEYAEPTRRLMTWWAAFSCVDQERLPWLRDSLLRPIPGPRDHSSPHCLPFRPVGCLYGFDDNFEQGQFKGNGERGRRYGSTISALRAVGRRERVGLEQDHACPRYRALRREWPWRERARDQTSGWWFRRSEGKRALGGENREELDVCQDGERGERLLILQV